MSRFLCIYFHLFPRQLHIKLVKHLSKTVCQLSKSWKTLVKPWQNTMALKWHCSTQHIFISLFHKSLSNATPPIGKIHIFSKTVVTLEQVYSTIYVLFTNTECPKPQRLRKKFKQSRTLLLVIDIFSFDFFLQF